MSLKGGVGSEKVEKPWSHTSGWGESTLFEKLYESTFIWS